MITSISLPKDILFKQTSVQQNLPVSKLHSEILDEFMPFILNEVEKEFQNQDDSRTKRNTREYGYSFFKMENNNFDYASPPLFFQKLGEHICEAFGHPKVEFTNIILSVYESGYYLEPHVDVNDKDRYGDAQFYFGEQVYGLIVEADETGHLYFVEWHDGLKPPLDLAPVYTVNEEPGSIFCLEGGFRKSPYFHGVSNVSQKRISITFRTVVKT